MARSSPVRRRSVRAVTTTSPTPRPATQARGQRRDRRDRARRTPRPAARRRSRASTTRRTAAACCATPPRTCTTPTRRASSCWAPVFGQQDVDALEADLTDPARRRADRRADGRDRPGRRRRRPARSGTSSSRSGRPTPVAATSTSATSTPRRSTPTSPASAAASPTATAIYRFTTIKPGPYPWKNHRNAWRPAHIHFSLFGTEFTQRMVTQMYFPGDPLFALDPIYQAIVDPAARERLVATYDHDVTQHEWCTGYRWDIVLTGSHRTPLEEDAAVSLAPTPGQTVGPFFGYAPAVRRRLGAGAGRPSGRGHAARPRARRRRRAGAGRADRALAGRARRRRRAAARGRCAATGSRSPAGAARRPTRRATTRSSTLTPGGAVLRAHRVRPRAARPPVHPRLPAGRAGRRVPRDARWPSAATLVAAPDADGFVFDIRLQGEGETVFLVHPRD